MFFSIYLFLKPGSVNFLQSTTEKYKPNPSEENKKISYIVSLVSAVSGMIAALVFYFTEGSNLCQ